MAYPLFIQSGAVGTYGSSEFMDDSERRILVVDDEEQVRNLLSSYLGESYLCSKAASADEALQFLAAEPHALVIADVVMPGRNGIELLREITARHPDTMVVMVSGIARTQRVLDAVRLGAYDYLIKPCDLDVLSMTVERALERRALLRAARHYKVDLERRNEELRRRKAELESLQSQIVQSEKMASIGQLAAGVAHELNNPAGFLYVNMELLGECACGLERLLLFYETVPLASEDAARARAIARGRGSETHRGADGHPRPEGGLHARAVARRWPGAARLALPRDSGRAGWTRSRRTCRVRGRVLRR